MARLRIPAPPALGRDMNLIIISLILANIGTHVEQRFFQLYVRELGGSAVSIGLLATIASLVIVVLSPVGGWLTDRYRRVKLYAAAPLLGTAGCLLMLTAPRWEWLIPGLILSWMPGLIVGPALFGLVSDLGPVETRGTRFAYQMAAAGVCATLGPLVGGYIYKYFGYRTFLAAQAGMLALASLVRFFVRDPRDSARRDAGYRHPGLLPGLATAFWQMAGSRQFMLVFLVSTVATFGMGAAMHFTSVFMNEVLHVSEADMGILYAVAGAAGIAASLVGGVAADRFGRKPVLALTVFGMSLGLLWFSGARTLASLGGAWLFQGFAGSLGGPAADALMADLTEKETRGTVRSVFTGLQTLAFLPAPVLGGLLWERVAPVAPFYAGAAIIALAGAVLVIWVREPGRAGASGVKAPQSAG
ncbi:MAG: MFS transporter [Bacillota bacterium]